MYYVTFCLFDRLVRNIFKYLLINYKEKCGCTVHLFELLGKNVKNKLKSKSMILEKIYTYIGLIINNVFVFLPARNVKINMIGYYHFYDLNHK